MRLGERKPAEVGGGYLLPCKPPRSRATILAADLIVRKYLGVKIHRFDIAIDIQSIEGEHIAIAQKIKLEAVLKRMTGEMKEFMNTCYWNSKHVRMAMYSDKDNQALPANPTRCTLNYGF